MAAEFKKSDFVEEGLIEAPLKWAENLDVLGTSLDATLGKLKAYQTLVGNADTVSKVAATTKELTGAQQELNKIQTQIASNQAKMNAGYAEQVKALDASKKSLKTYVELGDQNAKTVNAQNSSVKQLSAALSANRAAYESLNGAEARNSQVGKDLLATIQQQDKDLKELKNSVGQNFLEVGKYENALKNLKVELKAARNEAAGLTEEFGEDSKQAREAALKVGELQDKIGDLNEASKAVSGEPIERLAGSFGLIGTKLRQLDFKGASAAVKQFAQASKDLTFKEATKGLGGFGQSLATLGKAILTNPLFLITAAIALIGIAVYALRDKVAFLHKAFELVGNGINIVIQAGKDLLDWVGLTTFALDELTDKVVENQNRIREAVNKMYDDQAAKAAAIGNSIVAIEIKKQKAISETSNIAIRALYDQLARVGFLTDAQKEELDKQLKIRDDANKADANLQAAHAKQLLDLREQGKNERIAQLIKEENESGKLNQQILQNEIKNQEAIANNEKGQFEDRFTAIQNEATLRSQLASEQKQAALQNIEDERKAFEKSHVDQLKSLAGDAEAQRVVNEEFYKKRVSFRKQQAAQEEQIEEQFQQALIEIQVKSNTEKEKNTADFIARNNKQVADSARREYDLVKGQLDAQVSLIKQAALEGRLTKEEADKQINKTAKQLSDEYIQIQIDETEKILLLSTLTADEQLKAQEKLNDLRLQLQDALYQQLGEKELTWQQQSIAAITAIQKAYSEVFGSLTNLTESFTERRLQQLDLEKEAVQTQRAALLKEYEGDKNRTAAINAEFDKKEEAIELKKRQAIRKQAQFEKGVALAQATIALALAVVKALTAGPFIGQALAIATAVAAGIQVAAIAARPIPAAAKGIANHKGGPIIAGELGAELVRMPGNILGLTAGKATMYDLPAGTSIEPHNKTMSILGRSSFGDYSRGPAPSETSDRGWKNVERAIRNKKEIIVNGHVAGYRQGGTRVRYLNAMRNKE